jgi:hypothetical protein
VAVGAFFEIERVVKKVRPDLNQERGKERAKKDPELDAKPEMIRQGRADHDRRDRCRERFRPAGEKKKFKGAGGIF